MPGQRFSQFSVSQLAQSFYRCFRYAQKVGNFPVGMSFQASFYNTALIAGGVVKWLCIKRKKLLPG